VVLVDLVDRVDHRHQLHLFLLHQQDRPHQETQADLEVLVCWLRCQFQLWEWSPLVVQAGQEVPLLFLRLAVQAAQVGQEDHCHQMDR
jgi:hypothetical protein